MICRVDLSYVRRQEDGSRRLLTSISPLLGEDEDEEKETVQLYVVLIVRTSSSPLLGEEEDEEKEKVRRVVCHLGGLKRMRPSTRR